MNCKTAKLSFTTGVIAALLLALLAMSFLEGSDGVAQASSPDPVSAAASRPYSPTINERNSPLVIPAAAFSDDGVGPTGTFFYFSGGYMEGRSGLDGCVKAPVYLPAGAKITSIYATIYDNNVSTSTFFNLYRTSYSSGATDMMGSMVSTSVSTSLQTIYDLSIDYPVVTLPNYSYFVGGCLGENNTRLYSVRIWFTSTIYLPTVFRDSVSIFEGPWELEPNNDYLAPNGSGSIRSNQNYYGYPNDTNDNFYFKASAAGPIVVDLTNHTGTGVQLLLYNQNNLVAFDQVPPFHLDYSGAAGWYVVRIYTASGFNTATSYTLKVTYP